MKIPVPFIFALLSVVAAVLLQFNNHSILAILGFCIGIALIIWTFMQKQKHEETIKGEWLEIPASKWNITYDNGTPVDTVLRIQESEHNKGKNIQATIEQVEFARYEFDPPKIENGNIEIRFAKNNFPPNFSVPLRIYIAGRG